MKESTIKTIIKALDIARAKVDAEYSTNYLKSVLDINFAKANLDHQTDLIDLSEKLLQAEREFKQLISEQNDNNNK